MFQYSKTAALVAIAALVAPAVCQAQDLVGSLGQAEKLNKGGKPEEAIKLCNAVLKKFEANTKVAQQFKYMAPFYYWQRATAQLRLNKLDDAYESFRKIAEDAQWKDDLLRQRAKDAQALASGGKKRTVGYDPLLTMSLFQMGYLRFKQAAGDGKTPGDPAKFDDAIKNLEAYLELLEKGKVSAQEREQKLNGQVCFLLLQSYLLKEKPDFAKGTEYLERSRKGKGKLPEDMVMDGLNTIIGVALDEKKGANADMMDLAYKALSTIPAMEPTAAAPNVSKFIAYGSRAASFAQRELKAGNAATAEAAGRIMATVFGMVPGTDDVLADLEVQSKWAGKDPAIALPVDSGSGRRYSVRAINALNTAYGKLVSDNTDPEAYALLSAANVNLSMGSNRMGKAGFQVLLDRYPGISNKNKEGKVEQLAPKLKFQLAQLQYLTGNEAVGQQLEASLSDADLGDEQSKNLVFNKMRRLLKENNWEGVIPVAEEVVAVNKAAPSSIAAATAQFVICAANFKLGRPDEVVAKTEAFLASGNLKPGTTKNDLKPAQVADYEHQLYFFLIDAYNKLGASNPANYDKVMETFDKFRQKYPSNDEAENKLISNTVYTVVDALLKRATMADEEGHKADVAKALEYAKLISDNWPACDVYPAAQLLRGNIMINGDDDAAKPEGMKALEMACEAALKQENGKGKPIAANALYLLYSYGPEFKQEGETDEALAARMKQLADRFWNEADHEGNNYALDMSGVQLRRDVKNKAGKDVFEADLAKAREVIAREATYAFKNNRTNKGLEMAINSYVDSYVEGNEALSGQKLTADQVIGHLESFPGIQPDDKYTQAILYMARITQLQKQMDAIRQSMGDNEAENAAKNTEIARMRENVQTQIRQMRNKFKPEELTDFICLQVGDNLVNFVEAVGAAGNNSDDLKDAVSYYDKVIERKSPQTMAATVGKARAAKLSGDVDGAITLLTQVTAPGACSDGTVVANALYLLTESYLQKGDTAKALATGKTYLNNRSATRRIEMNMLMANAYQKAGDAKNALVTYMNIYSSNKGNVKYSAPACAALMKLLWERNTPTSGDRLSREFKNSDRWTAWNTGADYVKVLKANKFEEKMNSEERTAFREVEKLVEQYGSDPAVQREESDNRRFRQQLGK